MAGSKTDYDSIKADLASLRGDVRSLASGMKQRSDRAAANIDVSGTLSDLSDQAGRVYDDIASRGRDVVGSLGDRVGGRPVAAILIAFIIGFIGSRLLERR